MACGEPETVWVTWKEWCWKGWGPFKVPWRCTKGGFLTRYRYDFAIVRPHLAFFHTHYEACCEFAGGKFEWSSNFCLFCEGNAADHYNETWYFKNPLAPIGDCDIGHPPGGVDLFEGGPAIYLAGPTDSIPKPSPKPIK